MPSFTGETPVRASMTTGGSGGWEGGGGEGRKGSREGEGGDKEGRKRRGKR